MNKDTSKLIGKTIKSVDTTACNAWKITFNDGSYVEVWAESDGPLGISQIWLDNFKE